MAVRCMHCHLHLRQRHECSADKMRRGIPLDDNDRWPWLHALASMIASHLQHGKSLVMGCSALKEAYRDVLRGQHPDAVLFVRPCQPDHTVIYMHGSRAEQSQILLSRPGNGPALARLA